MFFGGNKRNGVFFCLCIGQIFNEIIDVFIVFVVDLRRHDDDDGDDDDANGNVAPARTEGGAFEKDRMK
jgi:hypothetical protein